MYFLFTAININRRYVFAYYRKKKKSNNITFSLNLKTILQKKKKKLINKEESYKMVSW